MCKGNRIRNERKAAARVADPKQFIDNLGISAKMVVDLSVDDSIVDHRQEMMAGRYGALIGVRSKDLSPCDKTLTIYDLRKARMGDEISDFLSTVDSGIFPIENIEYGEVYQDASDQNLFHRLFSYVTELVYFSSLELLKTEPSFGEDKEAFVWTHYADQLGDLFQKFIKDECRMAA